MPSYFLKQSAHQGTINIALFYTKFGGMKHNHGEEQKQCTLNNVKSNHKGPTEVFVEKKKLQVIIWFQKSLEISLGWTEFQKAQCTCECHKTKSSLSP